MSAGFTRFHTKLLTSSSLSITGSEGIQEISMVPIGTASLSITGDAPYNNSANNDTLPLPAGLPLTLSASGAFPIGGLTITAVGGTVLIIMKF